VERKSHVTNNSLGFQLGKKFPCTKLFSMFISAGVYTMQQVKINIIGTEPL
jgi:hypothetical protein